MHRLFKGLLALLLVAGGCGTGAAVADANLDFSDLGPPAPDLALQSPDLLSPPQCPKADGLFAPAAVYNVGTLPSFAIAADLDGDDKIDLVVADSSASTPGVAVLINKGDGTFSAPSFYSFGQGSLSLAAEDFDGDGWIDLAAADAISNQIEVLANQQNGKFSAPKSYSAGGFPNAIVAADLNGDKRPDIAATNYDKSGAVSVFMNNGNGVFLPQVSYSAGGFPRFLAAADFNRDGRTDIAAANEGDAGVMVFLNQGKGTFPVGVLYPTGSAPRSIAVADYDEDGAFDLAVANWRDSFLSILHNSGDGTFAPQIELPNWTPSPFNVPAYVVTAADFDGDGIPDLVEGLDDPESVGWMAAYLNCGGVTFSVPVGYKTGALPQSIVAADLNGDGKTDLASVSGYDGTISVHMNVKGN